jgi:hypothetical protein
MLLTLFTEGYGWIGGNFSAYHFGTGHISIYVSIFTLSI